MVTTSPCLHQRYQASAGEVVALATAVGATLLDWQRRFIVRRLPRHPSILTCLEERGHAGDHRNIDGETWPA